MAKNNLNEDQNVPTYVDPKVRRKQLEDAWIITETMRQKKQMTPRDFKKFIKKEVHKKFSIKQKIATLGGGVVGLVSGLVGTNYYVNSKADSIFKENATDNVLKIEFYKLLKDPYIDYAKENNIDIDHNMNWAESLSASLIANGRAGEGNLLLDLYNQAESGDFELESMTEWLEDNGLSQYFNENTDQLIKDSYVQAYQDVYGNGPVTQSNLMSWINSFYDDNYSTKEFNDMMLLLIKTDSSMVKVYSGSELTQKLLAFGVPEKDLQDAHLTPADEAVAARNLLCNEYAESHGFIYMYGSYAASYFIHAAMESGNAQDMADATAFLNEFMALSTTYETYNISSDMLPSEVLKEFGYEGDLIGLIDNLEDNDYVFASVMESKYDGVDCLKADGKIDFNNTGSLSGQELSNYQQDVANYENWITEGQNMDFTTWLQHEGYYDIIVSDAHDGAVDNIMANEAPIIYPSIILCTVVGVVLVRKFLTNRAVKNNDTIEEILKEHDIDVDATNTKSTNKPNKPGNKPGIDDSDDYFTGPSVVTPNQLPTDNVNLVNLARR